MTNYTAPSPIYRWCLYLLLSLPLLLIHYGLDRTQSGLLIGLYTFSFIPFAIIASKWERNDLIREAIIVGMLLRLLFIPGLPILSDDGFRFIWDGQLQINGINPYSYTPTEIISNNYLDADRGGLNKELYNQLNSKDYYSIYPPLAQVSFYLSGLLSFGNKAIQLSILQFMFWIFDCISILSIPVILRKLHLPLKNTLLYVLNPLIIIELSGNIHMEQPMIAFIIIGLRLFLEKRQIFSAVCIGIALGFKFTPLFLLPLLIIPLGLRSTIKISTISLLVFVACYLIYLNPQMIDNILNSAGLYFHTFEFNGAFYYLYKLGGNSSVELQSIFKWLLPTLTVLVILLLSLSKTINLQTKLLIGFSVYLLFSTTVHPWYITPLILASAFTTIRFPQVWSFLIFLTYVTYSTAAYTESYIMITAEYLIVLGYLIYEYKKFRAIKKGIN